MCRLPLAPSLFRQPVKTFLLLIFFSLSCWPVTVSSLQGSEQPGASLARYTADLKLPKHFHYHRDLLPYKDLVLWMKIADKTKYTQLCTVGLRFVSCEL